MKEEQRKLQVAYEEYRNAGGADSLEKFLL